MKNATATANSQQPPRPRPPHHLPHLLPSITRATARVTLAIHQRHHPLHHPAHGSMADLDTYNEDSRAPYEGASHSYACSPPGMSGVARTTDVM